MSSNPRKKNLIFWLIVFVCSAPVVLATVMYYYFKPTSFINYGELIKPPVSISDMTVNEIRRPSIESAFVDTSESNQKIDTLTGLGGRWMLAYINTKDICELECLDSLYLTRQVRLMTGKNRFRVERVYLDLSGNDNIAINFSDKSFQGLWYFGGQSSQSPFKSTNISFDGIWIVDPMGNLVMRYPVGANIKKVYKDLSRLLKASRIG